MPEPAVESNILEAVPYQNAAGEDKAGINYESDEKKPFDDVEDIESKEPDNEEFGTAPIL